MAVRVTKTLVAVRPAANLSADGHPQKAAVAARVCLNRYLRTPWIVVAASLVLLDQREAPGRLNRDSPLLFALLWVVAVNACENLTMRRLVAGRPPAAEKVA